MKHASKCHSEPFICGCCEQEVGSCLGGADQYYDYCDDCAACISALEANLEEVASKCLDTPEERREVAIHLAKKFQPTFI